MSRRGTEREGERESQTGSSLLAQSPMWGSIPQAMRSWRESKSRVRRLTNWATKVPKTNDSKTSLCAMSFCICSGCYIRLSPQCSLCYQEYQWRSMTIFEKSALLRPQDWFLELQTFILQVWSCAQVKTTMSQLPPNDSKFKIHSDFIDVKMLKTFKEKKKEKNEGQKGQWKGS